jgi:trimeric autotransporter adhesin
MKTLRVASVLVGCLSLVLSMSAQTSSSNLALPQVPPLIQFSHVATDEGGNTLSGMLSITFSLYNSQQLGEPLWTERQNVQLDPTGHYSVQLGITKPAGVPTALFTSGEARWLGVRIAEQEEQPRVLLLSVPYALKAGDAATIGGLPPSAFVLAAPLNGAALSNAEPATGQGVPPPAGAVTGTGTVNFVPLWDTTSDIVSSAIFQSGTGTTAKIGINTNAPAVTLDVKGSETVRGILTLPNNGTATATTGKNSQPFLLKASVFNSSASTAVPQTFQWQAEPVGNNTGSATGSLNLLFGQGTTSPAETGLHIASNGQITFAAGQTFPGTGTGDGTITGVTAGTDLTGGGASGNVTVNLDTTKVPQLNTANTFTGNQTISGNLSATGVVTGSGFQIGSTLFAFGSFSTGNSFLGFAGNSTMMGEGNTASGQVALGSNTTGADNVATGVGALRFNTTGSNNVADGAGALGFNTTGSDNTASGDGALPNNTTGGSNTAAGDLTLFANTTGSYNTANGALALEENSTGSGNTANGYEALFFNTASDNTANGYGALLSNTSGTYNTANGYEALYSNTTASTNTADGVEALYNNTTGSTNTASGFGALVGNTTGVNNTAVGGFALATNTTGNFLTCLGTYCNVTAANLSNATAIGAYATVSESNAMVLGTPASQTGLGNVLVGIDVSSPTNILTVLKGGGHAIADGWDTYSSRRWKTNIQPLQGALGLVEQLRGVSYDLKESGKHEIGVIAEEVGEVVPEVVTYEENGKDARGVDYSRLTALLIEATKEQDLLIQRQQAQIQAQQKQIQAQQQQTTRLASQVREIRASLLTSNQTGHSVRTVKNRAALQPNRNGQ